MGAGGEVKPQYSLRKKKTSGNLMLEVCLVLKEISRNEIKGLVPLEGSPTQLTLQFVKGKSLLNYLLLKSSNTNTNNNLTMVSFANL